MEDVKLIPENVRRRQWQWYLPHDKTAQLLKKNGVVDRRQGCWCLAKIDWRTFYYEIAHSKFRFQLGPLVIIRRSYTSPTIRKQGTFRTSSGVKLKINIGSHDARETLPTTLIPTDLPFCVCASSSGGGALHIVWFPRATTDREVDQFPCM